MVTALLASRPGDFRIVALDNSLAMIQHCKARAPGLGDISAGVGALEAMPFPREVFDVTLAMGVLEYAYAPAAVSELSRVTKNGGTVIISMLNPISPYRVTEWLVSWPLLRLTDFAIRSLRIPSSTSKGPGHSGIRAISASKMRRLLKKQELQISEIIYYDTRILAPPFDHICHMFKRSEAEVRCPSVVNGWARWLGTAYLVVATKER
jgi:SAM-dependent methyltransferase